MLPNNMNEIQKIGLIYENLHVENVLNFDNGIQIEVDDQGIPVGYELYEIYDPSNKNEKPYPKSSGYRTSTLGMYEIYAFPDEQIYIKVYSE